MTPVSGLVGCDAGSCLVSGPVQWQAGTDVCSTRCPGKSFEHNGFPPVN